jgi:hypothetical protein
LELEGEVFEELGITNPTHPDHAAFRIDGSGAVQVRVRCTTHNASCKHGTIPSNDGHVWAWAWAETSECFEGIQVRYDPNDLTKPGIIWMRSWALPQCKSKADYLEKVSNAKNALRTIQIIMGNRFGFKTKTDYFIPMQTYDAQSLRTYLSRFDLQGFQLKAMRARTYNVSYLIGEAIQSLESVSLGRMASEIAVDGLVLQSLASIAKSAITIAKRCKIAAFSKEMLDTCNQLFDFGSSVGGSEQALLRLQREAAKYSRQYHRSTMSTREVLNALASYKLATDWGVSAPIKDYVKSYEIMHEQNMFSADQLRLNRGPTAQINDGDWNVRLSLVFSDRTSASASKYQEILMKYGVDWASLPEIYWETKPMSFLLDWIIDIGSLFTAMKNAERYTRLDIVHAWCTCNYRTPVEGYPGVTLHYYDRADIAGQLPENVFPFHFRNLIGTFKSKNVGSCTALITQAATKR